MKNIEWSRVLLILIIFSMKIYVPGRAYVFHKDNIGTTGGSFLKIVKGVRTVGMGEAYCGVGGSLDSIFSNPAGLNSLKAAEVSVMHAMWFEDIYYDYVTFAYPGNAGVVGFSVNYLGMDKIDKYYNTGVSANDTYMPYDILAYISYANKFNENLLGMNIKYIQSVIDDESAYSISADFGYMKNIVDDKIIFGAALQNAGTEIQFRKKREPLPLNIKMGISVDNIINRLLLTCDVNLPYDNSPSAHIGIQYGYLIKGVSLKLRTGFKTTTITDHDPLSGISAGLGIGIMNAIVDYAWVPYGNLGNTHRISLSYSFSSNKSSDFKLPYIKKKFQKKMKSENKEDIIKEEKLNQSVMLQKKKEYFMAGHNFFINKDYDEAIEQFEKILELDPSHFESIRYIERAEEAIISGQ